MIDTDAGWVLVALALLQIPLWAIHVVYKQKRGASWMQVTTRRHDMPQRFSPFHTPCSISGFHAIAARSQQLPADGRLGSAGRQRTPTVEAIGAHLHRRTVETVAAEDTKKEDLRPR